MRNAEEVVDRPVEGIDVPADAARAAGARPFFGNEGIIRPTGANRRDDRALGTLVSLRNEIGRARLRTDAGGRRAPELEKQGTRLTSCFRRESKRIGRGVAAHALRAPGLPSSTTKDAVVVTEAVGWRTVDTARKSVVRRFRSRVQRT